jgi:hypothetical protein
MGGHHIIEHIHAQSGCHEEALLLPELALRSDQARAQDGQKWVEGEIQILHVVALVRLEYALQALGAAHHHHGAL